MNVLSERRPAVVWGFGGLGPPTLLWWADHTFSPWSPKKEVMHPLLLSVLTSASEIWPQAGPGFASLPHLPHLVPSQAFICTLEPVIGASLGLRALEGSSCRRLLIVGQSPSQSLLPWPPLRKLCTPISQTLSPIYLGHFFMARVNGFRSCPAGPADSDLVWKER